MVNYSDMFAQSMQELQGVPFAQASAPPGANSLNQASPAPAPTTYNASTPNVGDRAENISSATASNEFIFPTGEEVQPYSGLPPEYRDQLLSFLMPQLQSGVQNMESNIDEYTQNALNTYRQEFERYIKEEIPRQIGNLANRGILSSSMGENTLSQTYSDALRRSSGMGYNTAMEAAKMKSQIPQTIGQLLGYGTYSEDPTQMYKLLASLISGEQP